MSDPLNAAAPVAPSTMNGIDDDMRVAGQVADDLLDAKQGAALWSVIGLARMEIERRKTLHEHRFKPAPSPRAWRADPKVQAAIAKWKKGLAAKVQGFFDKYRHTNTPVELGFFGNPAPNFDAMLDADRVQRIQP